jgi:hypothetical protein
MSLLDDAYYHSVSSPYYNLLQNAIFLALKQKIIEMIAIEQFSKMRAGPSKGQ